ncbi:hypothetical protein [Nonomuraea cavernae]|uniref:hypothetical protein n=1 Tax=Nonomuraea cavernae TaxID=2045107 RepID=UPI00166B32EA|nr:hypothetical protein [Nonomuraea cavernae]MCA2188767.1 hypothetical protein [Nonomuraea cavernae]
MTWIFLATGLGVAGVAVLAVSGARVLTAARSLNREVAAAHAQMEPRRVRLRPPEG